MPVLARLKDKGMADADKCPLCEKKEDHDHLMKKCQKCQKCLEVPSRHPEDDGGTAVENIVENLVEPAAQAR